MPERDLDKLRQTLLLTLSVPVKPGATHRLKLDAMFESRLSEAVVLSRYMEEAYKRGSQLARGDIDTKGVGAGRLYSQALIDAFEFTGKPPIPGLFYSGLMLSIVVGYSRETGRDPVSEANKLVRLVPYGSSVEDAVALVEGLEGVSASDYLLALDREGISRNSIRLHALSIGDLAEKLASIDKGFLFNLRGYSLLKEISNTITSSGNLVEAILRAYYYIGERLGVFEKLSEGASLMRYFMQLDRGEYKKKYDNDRLLGAVLFSVGLVHIAKGLPLP